MRSAWAAVTGCWNVVDHLGAPTSRVCGDPPQNDRLGGGLHVNLTEAPQFLTQEATEMKSIAVVGQLKTKGLTFNLPSWPHMSWMPENPFLNSIALH